MPLYEYRCLECAGEFETLVRSEDEVVCPHCGSASLQKLLSAPAKLSGRTARQGGHTCCGRDERCTAPPCSGGGGCRRD